MGAEKIKRVVVLMLENRSFDHLLGGVPGVGDASSQNTNTDGDGNVFVQTRRDNLRSPNNLDPKHEFTNVRTQLGPRGADGRFPMSGFVADALGVVAGQRRFDQLTADEQRAVQSVMDYFANDSLPALHALARDFMVCDRWFASVPGPTWPNRFFAMMGSCHGQLEMPTTALNSILVTVRAIAAQLHKDSIFSVLTGVTHRIYSDYLVPLSILLKGSGARASIDDFEQDVKDGTLPQFSWIEPDFSNLLDRANSQHAPEDVRRGDNLVARIYNSLRGNENVWNETLLVILHDEHGGYFDHVPPAPTCAADNAPSHPAFDYSYTGVRVPCVLVSPWLERGTFSDDCEHTSLLAFLCDQFALSSQKALLGRRTLAAGHFGTAPGLWSDALRTDFPDTVPTTALAQSLGEEVSADLDDLLAKLLSALHALAGDQAPTTPTFDRRVGLTADAETPDARIARAWQQGGTLDKDTVARMVVDVKKAFTSSPTAPVAPAKAPRARKPPKPRKSS